jgi:hypothetical protein
VAYANEVSEEVRQNRDLLIVGQPANLPLLAELADALPVRFDAEKNRLITSDLPFVYRRPTNIPQGYLEVFSSPWQANRQILLVSGNSEAGVDMAAAALVDASKRNQMTGNVALVDGEQVIIANGRLLRTPEVIAENEPMTTAEGEAVVNPRPALTTARPSWILPLLLTSVATIVLLILGVIATSWRRSMRPE